MKKRIILKTRSFKNCFL